MAGPRSLSVNQIIDWATMFGLVLALGILAMSVGLICSETAADPRTLTATGASGRTRRALTAVTAGPSSETSLRPSTEVSRPSLTQLSSTIV